MKAKVLGINDVHASYEPIAYTCFGLGSCVAVFLIDRGKKITGGAHIPMPASTNAGELRGADELIELLLKSLRTCGSDLRSLRAKITGGAHVFLNTIDIGRENTQNVLHLMSWHRIYVAASDIGGHTSRTARFFSETEDLCISSLGQQTYCI